MELTVSQGIRFSGSMSVGESRPVIRTATRMMTCMVMVLLVTMVRYSMGCFPMHDVFLHSTRWMQITSMNSRRLVEIGEEAEDIMIVETGGVNKHREQVRCMMEYGENRYLVKIEDEDEGFRYLCYQFTPLTDYAIRQGRTEESFNRKKVDCIDDYYTEDEEILVAYKDIMPEQCPLAGGYQLIMQQGMAVGGLCINSIKTYNPHIQFHCDGRGSGNVLVDFGKACEPIALTPYMGRRHLTHLKCVSHWEENDFMSVLLQMRDHPESFWCLHYKVVKSGGVGSDHGELLKVFLTVDGRCSSQAFGSEDVPRNTSMFGHLASYRPPSDIKCTEKVYVESCKLNEDKCLESLECPSYCGRCQKQVIPNNCSFPANVLGSWKVFNSDRQLEMTVEKSRIKSSTFGDFLCLGYPTRGAQDYTYSVVQVNSAPTCMPYYSCAELFSPSSGVLVFQLLPGFRSADTGNPLSCKESDEHHEYHKPPEPEEAFTLINQNKLHRIACNFSSASTFPTKFPGCKVAVHECSGTCHTFNVTFDIPSCGNKTERAFDIETPHICFAKISFTDGVYGILAKAVTSGRYLCWIFGNKRLFVATAEDCNQDSVHRIYTDVTADIRYDPVTAISLPLTLGNSAKAVLFQIPSVLIFSLLLAYILEVAIIANNSS